MTGAAGPDRPAPALFFQIPNTSVAAVVDSIERDRDRLRKGRDLRLRTFSGGRLTARRSTWRRRNTPPKFTGRMIQSGPDVVIRGTVRRAHSESISTNVYPALAVFMAAIAAFGVVTRELPPIVIGVGGCAAFTGIAVLMRRLRGPLLVVQANELGLLLDSVFRELPTAPS